MDDTGLSMPENCIAGVMVPIKVKNIAAIWLLVKVDANKPIPVAMMTYNKAATDKVKKLPLIGTPNSVTANKVINK